MEDIEERILNLSNKGLCCSQILLQIIGLDMRGSEDTELIKAAGALCYGINNQFTCGALSGGACALSLHANDKRQTAEYCGALADWFARTYGSVNCSDILGVGNPPSIKCKEIIEDTIKKCLEIIEEK